MKTLKDFVQSRIVESKEDDTLIENREPEVLEADDLPDFISEDKNSPHGPPPVLIMRRKSVRQFPNGQMVALYYVDKINKYVTVPYTDAQWSSAKEETTLDVLNSIVESGQYREIVHKNGNTTNINVVQAQKILEVCNKLNNENKF